MNKKTGLLGIALALPFLWSCTGREGAQESGESPAPETAVELYWTRSAGAEGDRITDPMGNSIPLTRYRRIVVISPGAVETLYLIGAEDVILAIPQNRELIWPEEKTVLLPTIGNQAQPDREKIVSLDPDLIIGNMMNSALIAEFNSRGYRGIIQGAHCMDDIFNNTLVLGILTGREDAAKALAAEGRAKLEAIKNDLAEHPLNLKGAFIYTVNPLMAFSDTTLAGEILRILGAENIASGLDAAQSILSPEYILLEDPDFLFGTMTLKKIEDVLSADPVIARTRAGRELNIRIVPSSVILRSSPRTIENLPPLYEALKEFSNEL
jgi:iron complex transport system substrate-binding protein